MGGWFRLARPADGISLYEVVEPLDHVSEWSECLLGHKFCVNEGACVVHDQWQLVSEAYLDLLRKTSVGDLAGQ